MSDLTFGIAAYFACGLQPAEAPESCWAARSPDSPSQPSAMPMLLRRRVTPIGQAALRSAWALPQLDRTRFVFASRNGEFDRTMAMLSHLATGEAPSPADFSLAVHNALPGLLSVATRNRGGHTALAAGIDSFGFGLMESVACLHESPDEPVILVYFDAPLPDGYPGAAPAFAPLALALLLASPESAPRRVTMTALPATDDEPGDAAATFLDFLQRTAPKAAVQGECMNWTWHHA